MLGVFLAPLCLSVCKIGRGKHPEHDHDAVPVYDYIAYSKGLAFGQLSLLGLNYKLGEQVINQNATAWHRRLGIGDFASTEYTWVVGVVLSVYPHSFVFEHIDVPDNLCACGEIVCPFCSYLTLGLWSIIALASHFDGEDGRALKEF